MNSYMGHRIPPQIMTGGGEAMQHWMDQMRFAPPPQQDPAPAAQAPAPAPLAHGTPTRAYELGATLLGGDDRQGEMRQRIEQLRQQLGL